MLEEKVEKGFIELYQSNPNKYEQLTNEYIDILKVARVYDYIEAMKKAKGITNENVDSQINNKLKTVIEIFKEKEKTL